MLKFTTHSEEPGNRLGCFVQQLTPAGSDSDRSFCVRVCSGRGLKIMFASFELEMKSIRAAKRGSTTL